MVGIVVGTIRKDMEWDRHRMGKGIQCKNLSLNFCNLRMKMLLLLSVWLRCINKTISSKVSGYGAQSTNTEVEL